MKFTFAMFVICAVVATTLATNQGQQKNNNSPGLARKNNGHPAMARKNEHHPGMARKNDHQEKAAHQTKSAAQMKSGAHEVKSAAHDMKSAGSAPADDIKVVQAAVRNIVDAVGPVARKSVDLGIDAVKSAFGMQARSGASLQKRAIDVAEQAIVAARAIAPSVRAVVDTYAPKVTSAARDLLARATAAYIN